jgi:hypothetical protein
MFAYIRRPSSSSWFGPKSQTRYSYLGDLSLLPLFAAFFCILIACTARTVPVRAEPPEPRPAAEILLGIGGRWGFWERLYATARFSTTTSSMSTTNEQMTTSSTLTTSERLLHLQRVCTAIICLYRLCTATLIEVTHNEWYRKVGWRRHPTFHRVLSQTNVHVY